MSGACLTVSQVQSIPWSAAPSSTWLLLVTSAVVTPVVTPVVTGGDCSKTLCDQGYSIGRSARFYSGERAGTVGTVFGKADRLLEDSAFGDDRDYAQSSNVSHCIRRDVGSLWISVIEGYRAEHISPVASPVGETSNGVGEGLPTSAGLGSCSGMPAICLIDIISLGTGSMRGRPLGLWGNLWLAVSTVFWRRHLGLLCSPSQASQLLHGACSFQEYGWPLDRGELSLLKLMRIQCAARWQSRDGPIGLP
ncbi:hypothetical protein PSN_0346 [Pseudomonas sp. NGC7]